MSQRDRSYGGDRSLSHPPPTYGQGVPHNQSIRERTACANIRRQVIHMDRSERLAIALMLIHHCFQEADKLTGLAEVELSVKGSQTFNEKATDIRMLCLRLPSRSLAELTVDILLPEVSFIPPTNPNH